MVRSLRGGGEVEGGRCVTQLVLETTQASELTRYQSSQRHSFDESKMTLVPLQLSATSTVAMSAAVGAT